MRVFGAGKQPAANDEHVAEPMEAAQEAVAVAPQTSPNRPSLSAKPIDAAQPLVSALDAASKLAADANTAIAALENLKHLLERQHPDPAQVRMRRAPDPQLETAPIPSPLPLHPPQMMSAYAVPRMPREPLLPAISLQAVGKERHQLDIRGFLVGFALSAMIGAVIYIYLAAG